MGKRGGGEVGKEKSGAMISSFSPSKKRVSWGDTAPKKDRRMGACSIHAFHHNPPIRFQKIGPTSLGCSTVYMYGTVGKFGIVHKNLLKKGENLEILLGNILT